MTCHSLSAESVLQSFSFCFTRSQPTLFLTCILSNVSLLCVSVISLGESEGLHLCLKRSSMQTQTPGEHIQIFHKMNAGGGDGELAVVIRKLNKLELKRFFIWGWVWTFWSSSEFTTFYFEGTTQPEIIIFISCCSTCAPPSASILNLNNLLVV